MNALRNQAQLIGYVGNDPEITELQGGKKLAKLLERARKALSKL